MSEVLSAIINVEASTTTHALQAVHAELVVDHSPFEIVTSDTLHRPEI
jgi:hypothetical protein